MQGTTHALIGFMSLAAANSLVAANRGLIEASGLLEASGLIGANGLIEANTMAGFVQPHPVNGLPIGPTLCAAAALLGALLPDIDAEESTIKGELGLAGQAVSLILKIFGVRHRGLTHRGLTALLALALGCLIGWRLGYADVGLAFGLGYLSHLIGDAMTKHGVPLLWPLPGQFHLLPGPLRIRTGGPVENLVFLAAGLALLWFLPDMIPPELFKLLKRWV